ncbi:hypothetical protein EDB89DRAFT_2067940 [Lactarius sanguifluus]|nr:hypothetical protein EDB89DRAFT_2067940 [Lactarius sanguifluus]
MTFNDHKYCFTLKLLKELSLQLMPRTAQTPAAAQHPANAATTTTPAIAIGRSDGCDATTTGQPVPTDPSTDHDDQAMPVDDDSDNGSMPVDYDNGSIPVDLRRWGDGQRQEYALESYDPDKPDLELQYLVTEANMMEDKCGPLTDADEEDLARVVYSQCKERAEDWSKQWLPVHLMSPKDPGSPTASEEKEWQPISPLFLGEPALDTDWRPVSPVFPEETAVPNPNLSPLPSNVLKGTKECPLEVYNVAHPGLPIYKVEIGPPKSTSSTTTPAFILVNTILDTGAESNYLTAMKASAAGAQIFPITTREIVGTGRTTTTAFASFSLRIRGLISKCYAYILDDASQFHYDLLLGCTWLKRHDTVPRWDNNAYELTHPEERTRFFIKPLLSQERQKASSLLTKIAWHLRLPHQGPRPPALLHHTSDNVVAWDNDSTLTNDGSIETAREKFGECVKRIIKEAVPGAFRDKLDLDLI